MKVFPLTQEGKLMVDTLKILGALLEGGKMSSGGSSHILKSVIGAAMGGKNGGGLEDLLGSVLGGAKTQANTQSDGGLGDILGGLLGGENNSSSANSSGGADLSDLIGSALNQFGHSEKAAQDNSTPRNFEEVNPGMVHSDACDQATLLIRAMINAAKSDGRLDDQEQAKITGNLGTVTQDEIPKSQYRASKQSTLP